MKIFGVGHVDPLCIFNENIQSWLLCMFNKSFSELVMWTLYACLKRIFRVSHMDPLCMFDENIQNWSCEPSMHVYPLCMFSENIQSWSCKLSMHV